MSSDFEDGYAKGIKEIKPLIEEIHDLVYQEGISKGEKRMLDFIFSNFFVYDAFDNALSSDDIRNKYMELYGK